MALKVQLVKTLEREYQPRIVPLFDGGSGSQPGTFSVPDQPVAWDGEAIPPVA